MAKTEIDPFGELRTYFETVWALPSSYVVA